MSTVLVPLFPTSPLTTLQAEEQETSSDKVSPYKTDLEYLDDHFQVRATPFFPFSTTFSNTLIVQTYHRLENRMNIII